jgi:hypothetical protein
MLDFLIGVSKELNMSHSLTPSMHFNIQSSREYDKQEQPRINRYLWVQWHMYVNVCTSNTSTRGKKKYLLFLHIWEDQNTQEKFRQTGKTVLNKSK